MMLLGLYYAEVLSCKPIGPIMLST